MKFQAEKTPALVVGAYGEDWFRIEGNDRDGQSIRENVRHSVIVTPDAHCIDWQSLSYAALTPQHFSRLLDYRPELVVFGSGRVLRFPQPQWIGALIQAGIGVESMDTAAACRTYNILAAEGRRVLGAFLLSGCS